MTSDTVAPPIAPDISLGVGIKERLLRSIAGRVRSGTLTIELPGGARITQRGGPGPEAHLTINRWRAVSRFMMRGDIGFADAYINGECSSPDLVALIELAARNQAIVDKDLGGTIGHRWLDRLKHWLCANTRSGSRRNIMAHYDLGNDFYEQWLDAGMSYSSGVFTDPSQSLDASQRAKQDRVLELLGAGDGDRVLEIGIGWGGMAERLAARGAEVTGLTLSPSQLSYAQRRLPGTDLQLRDYRDERGTFDRIVSIEMFEAVGREYWPVFFSTLKDRLVAGGTAVLQVITIDAARFEGYCRCPDFIQRYVFPGGMLPSAEILRSLVQNAGLKLTHEETFGQSYARTLAEWARRFEIAWPEIAKLGFGDRFKRLWQYYFAYCEAGFRAGSIDVGLYRIEKAPA